MTGSAGRQAGGRQKNVHKRKRQTPCRLWEGEYFIPYELAHLPVGTCCHSDGGWEFRQVGWPVVGGSWDMKGDSKGRATSLPSTINPVSSTLQPRPLRAQGTPCPSCIHSYLDHYRSASSLQPTHSVWNYLPGQW